MIFRTGFFATLVLSLVPWPATLAASSDEVVDTERHPYPSPATSYGSFSQIVRGEGHKPWPTEAGATPRTIDLLKVAAFAEASFEEAIAEIARTYELDDDLAMALAEATIAAWPVSETYTWPSDRHLARGTDAAERLRAVAALAPDHWNLQLDVARTVSNMAGRLAASNSNVMDIVLQSAEPIQLALALHGEFLNPMKLYGRLLDVEPDHAGLHVARVFTAQGRLVEVALAERAIEALNRQSPGDEQAATASILLAQSAFERLFVAGLPEQAIVMLGRLPARQRSRAISGRPEIRESDVAEIGEGGYIPPGVPSRNLRSTDLRDELALAYVLTGREQAARALLPTLEKKLRALIAKVNAASEQTQEVSIGRRNAKKLAHRIELIRAALDGVAGDPFETFLRAEAYDPFATSTSLLLARVAKSSNDRQARTFFLLRALDNARSGSDANYADDPDVSSRTRALLEQKRRVVVALEDEILAEGSRPDRVGAAIGRLLASPPSAAIEMTPSTIDLEAYGPTKRESSPARPPMPPGLWIPSGWPVGDRWNVAFGYGEIDGGRSGRWLVAPHESEWRPPRLLLAPHGELGQLLEAPTIVDGRVNILFYGGRLSTTFAVLDRDRDGDGWSDLVEELHFTDPTEADTDGDGIADPVDLMPQIPETPAAPAYDDPLGAILEEIGFLRGQGALGRPIVIDRHEALGALRPESRLIIIEAQEIIRSRRLLGRSPATQRIRWFLDRDQQRGFVRWRGSSTCATMGLIRTPDGRWRTKTFSWIDDC